MVETVRKNLEIIVIGCGVSGLTTGIRLLEGNFRVKILAYSLPPNTTSDIAAAYWSPFRVYPEGRVLKWGRFSLGRFMELCEFSGAGVSIVQLLELYDHRVEELWWKSAVDDYRRAKPEELPTGFVDGYFVDVPLIETPIYMNYLLKRFSELGGIINNLDEKIKSIHELFTNNRLIINCSGLGALDLCGDKEVYPIRGQIIRVSNPGIRRCYHHESSNCKITYIVPRSMDCILGGTAEENNWDTEVDQETANEILNSCQRIEPRLIEAQILEHRVGLRPGRSEVCLEMEKVSNNCAVIHNYGHGGAGFTLSWGCAEEALELTQNFLDSL